METETHTNAPRSRIHNCDAPGCKATSVEVVDTGALRAVGKMDLVGVCEAHARALGLRESELPRPSTPKP